MKKSAKPFVASDIMSKNVICVLKDVDLRDLGKLFLAKGITGAPVIDRDGDLCGVVSQTDLLYYQLTRDDELVLPSDF
jgi:CBS domain-containing protein